MTRPLHTPHGFASNRDLVGLTLIELRKNYNKAAMKKNGIVSNSDLEKVFRKTTDALILKNQAEKDLVESVYDSFAGALMLYGNSDTVFALLHTQLK